MLCRHPCNQGQNKPKKILKKQTCFWLASIRELRRNRRALLAATCFFGAALTLLTHMLHKQVKQSAHVNCHFSMFLRHWGSCVPLSLCCCTTSKQKYLGALLQYELTFLSRPHTRLQEQGMEGDTGYQQKRHKIWLLRYLM